MKPIYIVDEIGAVVANVSTVLLPKLQIVDPKIQAVNYLYGHPNEIIATLTARDKSPQLRFKKYPLVALFQDFPEVKGKVVGEDNTVTLHLLIASATLPTYKADERYARNFKPILYPIYNELLRQLDFNGNFFTKSPEQIEHTKIDRLYWGNKGIEFTSGKETKNIFVDWIDCIELLNLTLPTYTKIC
jgi:hypothetical protein